MYLFQRIAKSRVRAGNLIYIPLCIYFNLRSHSFNSFTDIFTFHYVSISTNYRQICDMLVPYLHSTMYLFQRRMRHDDSNGNHIYIPLCIYFNIKDKSISYWFSTFTFHYVSISTKTQIWNEALTYLFTFHYVSISTRARSLIYNTTVNLHSTMYLFQPKVSGIPTKWYPHLHSTMYLFQLARTGVDTMVCPNLHSTMYLFQPIKKDFILFERSAFTFHYVSIST